MSHMTLKVESNRMAVNMHVKNDVETDVRAFPASTEGYGNPAFVSLSLRVGLYSENDVQEITLYLEPDMAAQIGGALSLAAVDSMCPDPSEEAEIARQEREYCERYGL